MSTLERLEPIHSEVVDAIVAHPMVAGIGDGSLDFEPFREWVRQDYRYLEEYSRVFAYGAARSPDLDRMRTFAELCTETLETEMELHREYAASFGIDEAALEATTMSPTTRGYTDFLVRTAATRPLPELVAALLPCMWGFNGTAERLAADGLPDEARYAEWIETYAGDEFTELTAWCKQLYEELTADAARATLERCEALFETSARYEYRFWDAAWRGEEWSV